MRRSICFANIVFSCLCLFLSAGCQEKKTERKVTIEGPEKKHTLKMETTEKKHHD
jgi:hypothetical protein